MSAQRIRPIAICVIRRDDRILVFEDHDAVRNGTFYRPLGGAIEFGERSVDAVRRELLEEIDAMVVDLRLLTVLENIFTCDGKQGHEIVYVYEGRLVESRLYEMPNLTGREDNGDPLRVIWKSFSEFGDGRSPLYPDGLLEILTATEQAGPSGPGTRP